MPDFAFERACIPPVAGVDEAGRGPWAGPVVAAAVILPINGLDPNLLTHLDDSKKLNKSVRENLLAMLEPIADIGVGVASPTEIDDINILQATMLAMQRAVNDLSETPVSVLVDGNRAPSISAEVTTIIKGDSLSLSIAAASIVAKVTRDRIMTVLAQQYPGYSWERNAGYGTKEHKEALNRLGVTPAHRQSFAPIRAAATRYSGLNIFKLNILV
jgi:ribonuclease HII